MHHHKMRFWDADTSTMIYPDDRNADHIRLYLNGAVAEHDSWVQNGRLMISTGVSDKNNNEIYQGDYLRCVWDFPKDEEEICFVDYVTSGARFTPWLYCDCTVSLIEVEIIGNLYQNPELQEAEKRV